MEIRHLAALVAIAQEGSFSAAADQLGTVQSNVSAHIARLERELNATLVDRSSGRLTAEGDVVLARAFRIFSELDSLSADLGALRDEIGGTVRLGVIATTARWLVPVVLKEMGEAHPRVRVVVTDGTTSGLEPQLVAGRLDMAVVTLPVPGRDLTSEALFDEQLVLVVPRHDDPVDGRTSIALSELGDIPLLLPAPGTPFRAEIDTALRPAQIRLRPLAELDGVQLIAALTFEGHGPALLPATAVVPSQHQGFRIITVEGLPDRHVGLALRSRGLPSAPARAAIAVLRRIMAETETLPAGITSARPGLGARAEGAPRLVGVPNG